MEFKDVISIILAVITLASFVIFIKNVQDVNYFVISFWSCLITSISVAVLLVLNPWLVGKK